MDVQGSFPVPLPVEAQRKCPTAPALRSTANTRFSALIHSKSAAVIRNGLSRQKPDFKMIAAWACQRCGLPGHSPTCCAPSGGAHAARSQMTLTGMRSHKRMRLTGKQPVKHSIYRARRCWIRQWLRAKACEEGLRAPVPRPFLRNRPRLILRRLKVRPLLAHQSAPGAALRPTPH